MKKVVLKIALTSDEYRDLDLPQYMTTGSAGMDLCAALQETYILEPGKYKTIPTGIRIAVPPGFEAQVRPRSGLAARNGVTILNTPGTIDSDYRGEVRVILINHGQTPFEIKRNDRIAQLIISSVEQVAIEVVKELEETNRGSGGFGHTGV